MKYPVSIAFLLFFMTAAKAQPSLAKLPSVSINLKNTDDLPYHPGVFSHFEAIDERADTARIGIHNFDPIFAHARNRQLVFHRPAAMAIAEYLNTRFARPGAPFSALII